MFFEQVGKSMACIRRLLSITPSTSWSPLSVPIKVFQLAGGKFKSPHIKNGVFLGIILTKLAKCVGVISVGTDCRRVKKRANDDFVVINFPFYCNTVVR